MPSMRTDLATLLPIAAGADMSVADTIAELRALGALKDPVKESCTRSQAADWHDQRSDRVSARAPGTTGDASWTMSENAGSD
jgi:hypothetical protein